MNLVSRLPWILYRVVRSVAFVGLAVMSLPSTFARGESPASQSIEQTFRASQFGGASEAGLEGCAASSGEYSLWVYATASRCGVPRDEADQVVLVRQPVPGVAPLHATISIPGDEYHLWLYGSGEKGHPWLHVCGRNCLSAELPQTPAWVSFGTIRLRDRQAIFIRTLEVPYGHTLRLSALWLSSDPSPPAWIP